MTHENNPPPSKWPHGKIPLLCYVCLTPAQDAEFRADAARAGMPPLDFLLLLVKTEPGRFLVPVEDEAAAQSWRPLGG